MCQFKTYRTGMALMDTQRLDILCTEIDLLEKLIYQLKERSKEN